MEQPVTPPRSFIPALEGLRALAALGVLTTHVAFQTGAGGGRLWGRFDLWVAVFFALSGFLLWRGQAVAARQVGAARPSAARYYRARFVRIMPAYWLVVAAVLLVFPSGQRLSWEGVVANLTLTQIYVPLSLTDGLTQMWSLSVEGAFYVLLPVLGWLLWGLRGRRVGWRVPVLVGVSLLAVGWAWVPLGRLNAQMQVPAFFPWFGVGMVLAEVWADRLLGRREWRGLVALLRGGWVNVLLVAALFVLAAQPFMGPEGFVHPSPRVFALRVLVGCAIAFFSVGPLVVTRAGTHQPILCSAPLQALGRWSYGMFLWHVVVLWGVFQVLGVPLFGGHTLAVWVATVVLTVPLSAASYALVEEPLRRWLRAWEGRSRARGAGTSRDGGVTRDEVVSRDEKGKRARSAAAERRQPAG